MSGPDPAVWRAIAFGLHLTGSFPVPGLGWNGGQTAVAHGPKTILRLYEPGEREGRPPNDFAVERDAAGAYVFDHPFFGRFRVAGDGSAVDCAPSDLPDWLWQRLLAGQLLPLAALLHGLEPLHASAVAIGEQAVLIMGPSGAGKSSVALHLAASGAALMSDDVSALELKDGEVVAHAGAALASVDRQELSCMPDAGWRRLGEHEGEVRVAIERDLQPGPLPVAAVYVLARRPEATALEIGASRISSPEVLLGGTFNAYVRDAHRLKRQLEVCARLAETAPIREVTVPPGVGAGGAASELAERHGG